MDDVGPTRRHLRIVAIIVQHIEMLNQISIVFMLLALTIIHRNFLVRGNSHIIENPIYRSRIRRMNMHKYIYKTDRACLDTTRMDREHLLFFVECSGITEN